MARLNQPTGTLGPIKTAGPARTHEGGIGFTRDPRSELFLGAVTFLNEDTFYESADARWARLQDIIADLAVTDPRWVTSLVSWLRREANLRTAPTVIAAHAVQARLGAKVHGYNRRLVGAAVLRPDEAAEFLAYWRSLTPTIPSAVKRGLGDAMNQLTEYGWLKWRGRSQRGGYSMGDVLNLTHPRPKDAHQEALFAAILAHENGHEYDASALSMVRARQGFLECSREQQISLILHVKDALRDAGLTHEVVAGALGKIPVEVWERLIPTMGYQALLMNLRRMSEAGVPAEWITSRLQSPDEVARSRMYPIRFLSAYRNAPIDFAPALEKACNASVANIPELQGRTLVLVDCSGSMSWANLSGRGSLTFKDAAGVFGTAVALRAQNADLVAYGTDTRVVPLRRSSSLLRVADAMPMLGGTNTEMAVQWHYSGHDRVILLTDEQTHPHSRRDVFASVPASVPCFTWNLAGYRAGHAPAEHNRWTFGGLSDRGFDLIPLLEAGTSQGWPWDA